MAIRLLLLPALFGAPAAAAAEVISDITTTSADETRALELRAEAFWRPVLAAAVDMKMQEHMALYADVEEVITQLPSENTYVREALREALQRLRRADARVLAQAGTASQIAGEHLAAPAGGEAGWSFITGGQNFLQQALRRFADGGRYSQSLLDDIGRRQAEILPLLSNTAASAGDVLGDCRIASKLSFDVLKYDLYNKGVPKTPVAAKAVAHRLVDAAGATRHRFTRFITDAVTGIARDIEGRAESAAATVARSALAGVEAKSTDAPREPLIKAAAGAGAAGDQAAGQAAGEGADEEATVEEIMGL